MTNSTTSPKRCLHCGKQLVGRQTKYCSEAHRQAQKRLRKRSQSGQTITQQGKPVDDQVRPVDLVSVHTLQEIETELEAVKAAARTVTSERDKLRQDVNRLTDRLIESERQVGDLSGELRTLRETIASSADVDLTADLRMLERERGQLAGELEAARQALDAALVASADNTLEDELRQLEREKGALIGQLEAMRQTAENASVAPQQGNNTLLNIALVVVLVGIVLVVAGLFLGWFG